MELYARIRPRLESTFRSSSLFDPGFLHARHHVATARLPDRKTETASWSHQSISHLRQPSRQHRPPCAGRFLRQRRWQRRPHRLYHLITSRAASRAHINPHICHSNFWLCCQTPPPFCSHNSLLRSATFA